jgi:WD40 repeat protein
LGLASGALQGLELATGTVAHSSSRQQHEQAICSVSCSRQLLRFATCSADRCARVYDSRHRLLAVLEHGRPLAGCCFLNAAGDLLLASGKRLLVVKADEYLPRAGEAGRRAAALSRSEFRSAAR